MMQAIAVHYMNKYPNGQVDYTEDKLDVKCAKGLRRVSLRVTGAGTLKDFSAETGCLDKHDMSPIPKGARIFKLNSVGIITLDEKHEERAKGLADLVKDGKVLAINEYDSKVFDVDAAKGEVTLKK